MNLLSLTKRLILSSIVGISTILLSCASVYAQETFPFEHVELTKKDVTFVSNGIKLAGTLFAPGNHTSKPLPVVVIAHPFNSVKEQSPTNYAKRLAARGYAALVFDAAYQGASEGTPRYLEDPWQRTEDIKAAVTYLTTRDDISANKIGVLGICGAGGYVVFAAQTDHRIKAVATVSGVDIGSFFREGLDGKQSPAVLQGMLDTAAQLRTDEAKGAQPNLEHAVLNTKEEADAPGTPTMFREGYEYYRTARGQHPRSPNLWVFRSVDMLAQFDSTAQIELISPRPLLMIAGSKANTLHFSEEAIARAKAPKELFIIDGATHFDLYDKAKYVDPAVEKLNSFFKKYL